MKKTMLKKNCKMFLRKICWFGRIY